MMYTEQELAAKIKEAKKSTYAAYEVAEHYYGQKAFEKAFEWYLKAASDKQPVPMALYALGYAYQMGEGTKVDIFNALRYYEAAAAKEVPQAYYQLAYFYQNGMGVQRDPEKAVRYSEMASRALAKQTESLQEEREKCLQLETAYQKAVRDFAEKSDEWRKLADQKSLTDAENEKMRTELQQERSRVLELDENRRQDQKRHESLLKSQEELVRTLREQMQKNVAALTAYKALQARCEGESRLRASREGEIRRLTEQKTELSENLKRESEATVRLSREVESKKFQIDFLENRLNAANHRIKMTERIGLIAGGVLVVALIIMSIL